MSKEDNFDWYKYNNALMIIGTFFKNFNEWHRVMFKDQIPKEQRKEKKDQMIKTFDSMNDHFKDKILKESMGGMRYDKVDDIVADFFWAFAAFKRSLSPWTPPKDWSIPPKVTVTVGKKEREKMIEKFDAMIKLYEDLGRH